jgi:hypothetical protein
MKLTLPTLKKKTPTPKKKFRVDARRYWVILLCVFVLLLSAELVYFSLSFLQTSARITAPATPTLETNDVKIKHMQSKLNEIEKTVNKRTGQSTPQ